MSSSSFNKTRRPSALGRRRARARKRSLEHLRAVPSLVWALIVGFSALALACPDPLLALYGVGVLATSCLLLWRPGEPQILLFIVAYQWIQAIGGVLYAAYMKSPLEVVYGGSQFVESTILSLSGILALSIGIRLAMPDKAAIRLHKLERGLRTLNLQRLFISWAVLTVGTVFFGLAGRVVPGLSQVFVALGIWKWTAVLLLCFKALASRKGGCLVALVVLFEVSAGMLSYFSSFKYVLFVIIVAASGVLALRREKSRALLAFGALTFVMLLVWQGIKNEYRVFLRQGSKMQVVRVSVSERINWLNEAIFSLDWDLYQEGFESGLKRVGYIQYFGHSIRNVPAVIPHTNGKLWKEAALNPLMPRAFFPNKPIYNDSDRTNEYTGKTVATAKEGTSVSIGYMGESYIDFGRWGMFAPVVIWGALIGGAFKWLRRKAPHPLLGLALTCCLLLQTCLLLETSNVKMAGGFTAGFLVTAVILRVYGKVAWKWLTTRDVPRT